MGVAVTVLATALPAVTASASPAASSAVSRDSSVQEQVRHGGLQATHGVRAVCADAKARCLAQAVTGAPGSEKLLSTAAPIGYGATELERVYHLPQGNGAKGTIAIIDAGAYPNLESDVAAYRKQYGLPACTSATGCFSQVDLHGGPPLKPDPSEKLGEEVVGIETALDMEMASAACPDCKLVEVQVPIADALLDPADPNAHKATADFGTAARTAAKRGATAVSMSYVFPSDATNNNGPGKALFQPGVAMVAASGDSGFNPPAQGVGAPWPQNLPWVTSAGGNSLFAPTPTQPNYTAVAWNMAGSGCDTTLNPALGQPRSVSDQCRGHRAGSDISAVADPSTGVAVYDTYAPDSGQPHNWITVGGTSAASPLIAGMYVRGGHTAGVIGPNRLYGKPTSAFTDVTVGQNAPNGTCQQAGFAQQVCTAGVGWDGPTGLGSPHGLSAFQ
ncbi:MAG: S53 family peptidase [Sciscionella sp.]